MTAYYDERYGLSPTDFIKVPDRAHRPRRDAIRARAMRTLTVNGIRIDDTFAEAFGMRATAIDHHRRQRSLGAAGRDDHDRLRYVGDRLRLRGRRSIASSTRAATPDGRPGVRVLLFAVSTSELQKQLSARVGQCVLTSPGSACYRRACRRGKPQSSATRCAISATAGRSRSASAASTTGAFR